MESEQRYMSRHEGVRDDGCFAVYSEHSQECSVDDSWAKG